MIRYKLHIIWFYLLLQSCGKEAAIAPTFDYPKVKLELNNQTILAGDDLTMTVLQENPSTCDVILSNGIISLSKRIDALQEQRVQFAAPETHAAGTFTLRIIKHDSVLYKQNIKILPIDITDPIDIYAGPRTINVDQKQQSMIVAIPRDEFGNAVADGLEVKFSENKNAKDIGDYYKEVEYSLAYRIIEANQNAEDLFIGVSHPKASSKKQKIISIPSWPTDLYLSSEEHFAFANNRNFVKIKTNRLTDEFGNAIPDGTILNFHIFENGIETAKYNGITIDGVAFVYLKNPFKAASWFVRASIGDKFIGRGIEINFANDLQSIIYTIDEKQILVGPLRGQLGQYLSDGSKVNLELDGRTYIAETLLGIARFDLEDIQWTNNTPVTIRVAGLQKVIYRND